MMDTAEIPQVRGVLLAKIRMSPARTFAIVGCGSLAVTAVLGVAAMMTDQVLYFFADIDGTLLAWLFAFVGVTLLTISLALVIDGLKEGWVHFLLFLLMFFVWFGVILFGLLTLLAVSGRAYTTVVAEGEGHDVVAFERSFLLLMSGTLYERSGLILSPIESFSADDGFQPFSSGEYDAHWVGDTLHVRYNYGGPGGPGSEQIVVDLD